jgi:hypothetical protein
MAIELTKYGAFIALYSSKMLMRGIHMDTAAQSSRSRPLLVTDAIVQREIAYLDRP